MKKSSVHFFQSGGDMLSSSPKRGYPNNDMLDGEARAVIEAEFEDITSRKQRRTLAQLMKEGFQWIKQRRDRA